MPDDFVKLRFSFVVFDNSKEIFIAVFDQIICELLELSNQEILDLNEKELFKRLEKFNMQKFKALIKRKEYNNKNVYTLIKLL